MKLSDQHFAVDRAAFCSSADVAVATCSLEGSMFRGPMRKSMG